MDFTFFYFDKLFLVQSSGNQKETNKKSKKSGNDLAKNIKKEPKITKPQEPKTGNDLDDDEPTVQADVNMVNALTGTPFEDDELLFAVPVIAPYNTLSNYK